MNQKVWIIHFSEFDGGWLIGAYSTEEKAIAEYDRLIDMGKYSEYNLMLEELVVQE